MDTLQVWSLSVNLTIGARSMLRVWLKPYNQGLNTGIWTSDTRSYPYVSLMQENYWKLFKLLQYSFPAALCGLGLQWA